MGCSGKLEVNQGIQCRSLSAWDAKNRIVRTDFGNLAINAVESPEPMFCDAGSGECDETGLCYIATEPRYRETVSETQDLRWALTPTGASAALWAEKRPLAQSFTARRDSALTGCAGAYSAALRACTPT